MRALSALFFLWLAGVSFAEVPEPLAFEVPPDWSVEFKGEKGLRFYAINGPKPGTELLMLSRWPIAAKKEELPELVAGLAKGFSAQIQQNKELQGQFTGSTAGEIKGDTYSGQFASFN